MRFPMHSSFEPLGDRAALRLKDEVLRKRDCGEVIFEIQALRQGVVTSGIHAVPVLDAFVEQLQCTGLRDAWIIVGRDAARLLLTRLLSRDLALNAPIMSAEDAARLAERFMEQFPSPSRFFTNANVLDDDDSAIDDTWTGSFSSLTASTFDTGIVAIGEGRIGILWIKDED